jgi:DNA-binding LacI/PurR family transcriptional regulator
VLDASKAHRGPVTLKDVASEAGVSITTVSRILNDRESGVPIRQSTRDRVLSVAADLGYRPNMLARGLRGSRSSLLGVIARDMSDPFHIQILRGINEVARQHDHRVFLGHVDYQPEAAIAYGSMFENSHADGIIVMGDIPSASGEAALDLLAEKHRYIVGVTDRTARRQIPGVYADSAAGTHRALDHLWELGHRAIVCVSDNRTYDGRLRIDRYEHYLHERGAGDRIQVFVTDQEPAPAFELGQRMFAGFEDGRWPTAIYATSDTTAIGLMQAAFQAGVAIPAELSIIGYDDIDISPFTIPPLTTVSQDGAEMGTAAADLLFTMIDENLNREEVSDIVLQPRLVVRQSTTNPAVSGERA